MENRPSNFERNRDIKKIMSFGRLKSNKRLSIINLENKKAVSRYFPTLEYKNNYYYS